MTMREIDPQEVQRLLEDMKLGEIGPATFILPNGEIKRIDPSEDKTVLKDKE